MTSSVSYNQLTPPSNTLTMIPERSATIEEIGELFKTRAPLNVQPAPPKRSHSESSTTHYSLRERKAPEIPKNILENLEREKIFLSSAPPL